MTEKTGETTQHRSAEQPPAAPEPSPRGPEAAEQAASETPDQAAEGPAAAEQAAPDGPYVVSAAFHKRLTTGLGGYLMALAACFLLVGAIVAITPRSDKEILPTADYTTDLWVLRSDADYPVHAPEGLPGGWRPTSSRLSGAGGDGPVAWHLGYVTPDDQYVALEQSDEKAGPYIKRMTNAVEPTGTQTVAGAAWRQYYRKDKDQRSLVRTLPGVTLVVTGTGSYDQLALLAGALKIQPKVSGAPIPAPSATR